MGEDVIYQFFYNGYWRMDWGFGNPNKTAAFILQLILLVIYLFEYRTWQRYLGILVFLLLSICLFHTFSRGGIISYLLSLSLFIPLFVRKCLNKRTYIILFIGSFFLLGYIYFIGLLDRSTNFIFNEDKSVTNRIEIWRNVPQMIYDAPYGWGIGNSGNAYMQWYQSLEKDEKYRTLVNSHFTYLVELNVIGRLIYIFIWVLFFSITFPRENKLIEILPFSVISSFFICSSFSSVAEEWRLWIIPIALTLFSLYRHLSNLFFKRIIIISISVYLLFYAIVCSISNSMNTIKIDKYRNVIIGDENNISGIIFADKEIVDLKLLSYKLKSYSLNSQKGFLLYNGDTLPNLNSKIFIFGGKLLNPSIFDTIGNEIFLYSPKIPIEKFTHKALKKINVFVGEFACDDNSSAWREIKNAKTLQSIEYFIPNPIDLIKNNN